MPPLTLPYKDRDEPISDRTFSAAALRTMHRLPTELKLERSIASFKTHLNAYNYLYSPVHGRYFLVAYK